MISREKHFSQERTQFQTFQNYEQWLAAIKERGADKTLQESGALYHDLTYGAVKGNTQIVGHWNPERQEGDAYSRALTFNPFNRKFQAKWLNKSATKATVRIPGSKGNVYEVAKDGSHCTCPGYTFRRTCKHVKAMKNAETRI